MSIKYRCSFSTSLHILQYKSPQVQMQVTSHARISTITPFWVVRYLTDFYCDREHNYQTRSSSLLYWGVLNGPKSRRPPESTVNSIPAVTHCIVRKVSFQFSANEDQIDLIPSKEGSTDFRIASVLATHTCTQEVYSKVTWTSPTTSLGYGRYQWSSFSCKVFKRFPNAHRIPWNLTKLDKRDSSRKSTEYREIWWVKTCQLIINCDLLYWLHTPESHWPLTAQDYFAKELAVRSGKQTWFFYFTLLSPYTASFVKIGTTKYHIIYSFWSTCSRFGVIQLSSYSGLNSSCKYIPCLLYFLHCY